MQPNTMTEKSLYWARIVSSIAATCISLACGTNYVYSAWGPQFGEKLHLSSTEQNLIGTFGNLGMYSMGIPIGMVVDARGPRIAVVVGAVLLGAGYFPLHLAYDRGSGSVPLLCLYSWFTGLGGCAAFAASVKTSALNWPHHRGTATGFPLAAFGLSAFFFAQFAQYVMPGSTGDFLLLLACGTSGITAVGFFFLRVLPHPHYTAVSSSESIGSNLLHRTKSEEARHRAEREQALRERALEIPERIMSDSDESSSLMSKSSSSPGDIEENSVKDHAHLVDIRGLKTLYLMEFWQLFALMGILAGIGLMTINNIGNDASALWKHYDDSASEDFIVKRQAMHVSIISAASFFGRLSSGVGSDFLVKKLHASRLWCLSFASLIFLAAQLFAISIENPNFLSLVSGLTGLAYGFLFGCFPSLVAEAFGVHGLSQNWGTMTLSPIISGNVFNIFYGLVYDKHSIVEPDGSHGCTDGLACYRSAYLVTVVACLLGLGVSLWSIWYTHRSRQEEERKREQDEREA